MESARRRGAPARGCPEHLTTLSKPALVGPTSSAVRLRASSRRPASRSTTPAFTRPGSSAQVRQRDGSVAGRVPAEPQRITGQLRKVLADRPAPAPLPDGAAHPRPQISLDSPRLTIGGTWTAALDKSTYLAAARRRAAHVSQTTPVRDRIILLLTAAFVAAVASCTSFGSRQATGWITRLRLTSRSTGSAARDFFHRR